jgi:hypothetical protein
MPNCVDFAQNPTVHNRTSPFGMMLPEGSKALQRINSDADPTDQISILVASASAEWVQKLEWAHIGVHPRGIPMPTVAMDY